MSHARYALSDDEDEPRVVTSSTANVVGKHDTPSLPSVTPDVKPDIAESSEPHVTRLIRAWMRERGTPEIQPWCGDLVDTVLDQIKQQQIILDLLAADESTSEEEHFRLNLVQLDMERGKWIVRSYLRVRLHKIERYAMHIAGSTAAQERLSAPELGYVRRYSQMSADHFNSTVLQHLPEEMRGLSDPAPGAPGGAGSMVRTPRMDAPVFVYCRQDCGQLLLPDGAPVYLAQGSIHLLQYRTVRALLSQRRIDLL
ncbi:GINS complex subunit [Malassezia cuniculi]|uniref:DNA replication complex GINS protein SLD5 n=1 Tax=Malassezia cuniculi TaxID=948313 RepID=A0AAF0ERU3_9BASI|nr:GINS complex subunit [Malassezia cuniculi]